MVVIIILILLAAASRLLPHPPNFAPVAAIGLFAGAVMNRRIAWIVPFAALLLSDLVLGFYHPVAMFWNYLAFAGCLALGALMLSQQRTFGRLVGATLASSIVFFAVSNFGMWASGYYPRTLAGFTTCYTMALPFFRNTLVSDALFCALLFGAHAAFGALAARSRTRTAHA